MEGEGSHGTNDSELRARVSNDITTRSASSSLRYRSLSSLGAYSSHVDDDTESESVSEVGDIGDRALHSNRYSAIGSFNSLSEEDMQLQSYGFWSRDPAASHAISTVTPLPEEIIYPLSANAIVCNEEKNQASTARIPKWLEYCSCMTHLAVFGILGVLTRYLLQKLFGPRVAGVTSDQTILYLDLPSNMVGSFLMGWFGVVFKADISYRSEFLAIGLTTGYLGSVTTFSGWNQKMLELSVEGHWVFAGLGFLIGLFLAAYSIIFGVETSKLFKQLLVRSSGSGSASTEKNWRVDNTMRHLAVLALFLLLLAGLWSMSGVLMRQEFNRKSSETQLWLACIVGPLGVWIRWFLARLNGRGLGKTGFLKWIPFGTLIANVSAACIMAALGTVKKEVNSKTCDIVATGIQFGFLGCLSTVSTFIAEFNAMRESKYPWRAYIYALVTILISFCLGTLIYSLPVWS